MFAIDTAHFGVCLYIYIYIDIYIKIYWNIGKDIYKDLLFSEQSNSSGMVSVPPVFNTDTSISHNASNSSNRSTCASADLSLDTQLEEILNILEELQG